MTNSTIPPAALEQNAEQEWQALRLKFLDRMWLGVLLVALVAVPISVARYAFTGWVAVYGVHIAFLVTVVTVFLLRRQLPYTARSVILIALMDFTAVGGVLSFALLGSAWWWMLMAGLVSGMLFSQRVGLIHTAVGILFLAVAAVLFVTGARTIDFDANEYIQLPLAWATMLAGPALLTIAGFWAIDIFIRATHQQLIELDQRRLQKAQLVKQLEASLADVKTLSGMIPICMHCKKIRDDAGYWENVEAFVGRHTGAQFTHALCQPCGVELYGELWLTAMHKRPRNA